MKSPILLACLLCWSFSLRSQTDTVPPVLECHGITNFFFLECEDTIRLADLIDTIYDNQSTVEAIELGMRQRCTGEGFPTGMSEIEVGLRDFNPIEIWARDAAGNVTIKSVQVYLSNGFCDFGNFLSAEMPPLSPFATPQDIHLVDFNFKAYNCVEDTLYRHENNEHYGTIFVYDHIVPPSGYAIEASASKNLHPLNGVTINDVVLISKHILGIQLLDSPYKIIAADANQDGKVTVYDMVILRKLILGLIDELPNGASWRFIPKNYVFPHPDDPFTPMFPTQVTKSFSGAISGPYEYVGVKIGDVDFSADPQQ